MNQNTNPNQLDSEEYKEITPDKNIVLFEGSFDAGNDLLTNKNVPQRVLDRINGRYGMKFYIPASEGRGAQIVPAYPQILSATWKDGSLDTLQRTLKMLKKKWDTTSRDRWLEYDFKQPVCIETVIRYPEYIICDDIGNPAMSHHISDYCSHHSAAMLLQIFWGYAVEMGLVSNWGQLPFDNYFGFRRVSASCVLAVGYKSRTRDERLLHDQKTKKLRSFYGRVYLKRLERGMARLNTKAGIVYHMHTDYESENPDKPGAWAHRSEFHSAAVPELPLAKTSTFSKDTFYKKEK